MKRNVAILIGVIFFVSHVFLSYCLAAEVTEGVTVDFNATTGSLILQASEKEVRVYLPETVAIQVTPRLGSEPVPADWDFLRHNLFTGTKVRLEVINRAITRLIITEVPQ